MTETKYDLEFYEYLDKLRRSGVTNMLGAAPYLVDEFGLENSEEEALLIVSDWMETFSARREAGETGD